MGHGNAFNVFIFLKRRQNLSEVMAGINKNYINKGPMNSHTPLEKTLLYTLF